MKSAGQRRDKFNAMDQSESASPRKNTECEQLIADDDTRYSLTIDNAAEYLLSNGFRTAPRTIAWHCQTNLLDCRKFTSGNTLKWKITRASLDERIETLKREEITAASSSEQLPASNAESNSTQMPAGASELSVEIIQVLRSELDEKNKQIAEFQNIFREHNKQFENLNRTIQLSNETIQQLNRTLALPQVRKVMESSNRPWDHAARTETDLNSNQRDESREDTSNGGNETEGRVG